MEKGQWFVRRDNGEGGEGRGARGERREREERGEGVRDFLANIYGVGFRV